jgi:RND family efflux transporter MFP subunit
MPWIPFTLIMTSLALLTGGQVNPSRQPLEQSTSPRIARDLGLVQPRAERLRGVVVPSQQVVLAAPVDGILAEVLVEEGQFVAADQKLLRMDDAVQRLAVEAARLRAESEAPLRSARLAVEEAAILVQRMEEAFAKDAASEWELRRMKLQQEQAQAEYDATLEQQALAQVNLRLEQQRLQRYMLSAPFDALVVRLTAEPGSTMTRGDQIASLIVLNPLEAHIFVPAEQFGRLEVGRSYPLEADAPVNRQIEGRLKTVDRVIDSASQTFRCVFEIDNPDHTMPAGFTVHLVLEQVD